MKSQNITFKERTIKWMSLYSMSENQLKKVWTILMRISKKNSSDHQNHWQIINFVCVKKDDKTTMCQLSTTQHNN
jgi:hypothetical protein